mgnify:CR=1 FL=1
MSPNNKNIGGGRTAGTGSMGPGGARAGNCPLEAEATGQVAVNLDQGIQVLRPRVAEGQKIVNYDALETIRSTLLDDLRKDPS